ncbi:MAG TPA: dihydroorotate dehydrogenase-like protein [Holophagaceae bacterium]|nr:dihydroorotate dehydrogenase-like protein [Holophagaceae bacterium]
MDLSTTYLGLPLTHPVMAGASPLGDDLDVARRLEDAGASALVLHSLFEEQIAQEQFSALMGMELHAESHPEALSYLPDPGSWSHGPEAYLDHIRRLKEALAIPIIASLNGTSLGGWLAYAVMMEQAGADAIELNTYQIASDIYSSSQELEDRLVRIVRSVKPTLGIPVTVKLSPHHTALPFLASRLQAAGADGLVLFNRFLQPDFDLDEQQLVVRLRLSDPSELLQRLHGLALLHGTFSGSLACSGGVHGPLDAMKAVMAGAHGVQVVSAVLQRGPSALTAVRDGLAAWLEGHEFESLAQARGSMSLAKVPNPAAYHRASYMRVLQSWRPEMLPP